MPVRRHHVRPECIVRGDWTHRSWWRTYRVIWAVVAFEFLLLLIVVGLLASAFASPSCVAPLLHRGFHDSTVDENTVRGILRSPAAEVDARLTADGRMVLMHNANVRGTTNGDGYVNDMTLDQIRDLRTDITGDQVPTLRQAIRAAAHVDIVLVVELKSFKQWSPDRFAAAGHLAAWGDAHGATVYLGGRGSGFERDIPRYAPQARIYWRPFTEKPTVEAATAMHADMVMRKALSRIQVNRLHRAGIVTAVAMHGSVEAADLADADYVMTDDLTEVTRYCEGVT